MHTALHLQAHADPFGQRTLREHCLHLRDHCAAQHAALGPDQVAVLLDAGYHSEVLWEVTRDDAADALTVQVLSTVQHCK